MKLQENKLYTLIFTFAVTFIMVFFLALVNSLTKDKVDENKKLFKVKAVLTALQIPFNDGDDALKKYSQMITEQKSSQQGKDYTVYTAVDNGVKKYGIFFTGDALWGTISGVIGVDQSGDRTLGLTFTDQQETPGLGGRIDEEWFKKQFVNEKLNDQFSLTFTKGGPGNYNSDDGIVDGVSGATITSESVKKVINKHIPLLKQIIGEVNP